jgi:hypothetical protein
LSAIPAEAVFPLTHASQPTALRGTASQPA